MADELTFMMGKYEAKIPVDRSYSQNHMWLRLAGDRYQVGFTAYAVRLLQDVYFLAWSVSAEMTVAAKQVIGEIESSKAVSDIYAPMTGVIRTFNDALMNDPSLINADGYGRGWLYEFAPETPTLLTPEQYVEHLATGWEATQRHLKGQMHND